MRAAAKHAAAATGTADDWVNDAAKGYICDQGDFVQFLDLSNLRIMTASANYLLAMKCLAMRLGAEFHDDVRERPHPPAAPRAQPCAVHRSWGKKPRRL